MTSYIHCNTLQHTATHCNTLQHTTCIQLHGKYALVTHRIQYMWIKCTQALNTYIQIHIKYISNIYQIHIKYISNTYQIYIQIHTKYTSNTYQIHIRYISNTYSNTHQIHIKSISNTYQIHTKYTSNTHQIHIKYISNTPFVYTYISIHANNIHTNFEHTLIERNHPPRGGFIFTMFPHQEPCVRGPPSKDLYQVLRGGSSYTRFLIREHNRKPPGGGGFFRSTYWNTYEIRESHTTIPTHVHGMHTHIEQTYSNSCETRIFDSIDSNIYEW